MKIAIVYPHSRIPVPVVDLFDALAVVTYEIGRRLARQHEVIVYPSRGRGEEVEDVVEGFQLHRIRVTPDKILSSFKLLDSLRLTDKRRPFRLSSLYYRPYAERVAADLARRQVDIAHIYGIANFVPIIRRQNPNIDIVLHSHDHALADFDRELTLRRIADTRLVLSCSNFVRDNIKKRYPEVADRCETLHNGIDQRFLDTASEPNKSRKLLFIGRLSPEKGVHVLLEAFARLKLKFPDLTLRLVGPQDVAPKQFIDPFGRDITLAGLETFYRKPRSYPRELQRRAAEIGGVEFTGPVPNSALAAHHADAAVFVFPSIWHEPFGIPPVEAMASGLPVVATQAGALPEIVEDGETGFIVDRNQVDALVQGIERLLADPELRRRMGSAARARAREHFTWDAQAQRLLQLYTAHCPQARQTPCTSRF